MLLPDYLDHIADDLLEQYSRLDDFIIRDIAQRLVKYGGVTGATAWQVLRAQEAGLLYDDIIAEVAKLTDASDQQVKAIFEDAGLEAMRWEDSIYEAAGLTPIPLRQSPAMLKVLGSGMRKTAGQLHNLTMTTALEAQQAYIQAATMAEMMVESGAFDYATAIRRMVKQAAKDGAFVQYSSGHRDRLDVAVRRAVLTGVNQTCATLNVSYADEMGCDLVETTAHPGARPEHMEWQGKVFSRSGRNRQYPDFITSTGYGSGAGLCGWNCRHSFYPFFEGLSASAYPRNKLREYEEKAVTYNGEEIKYYDATQRQRAIERSIRATKRELVGLKEAAKSGIAGADADFAASAAKLKKQEAQLKDYLQQTGLHKDSARIGVLGFGHSEAIKAVWAARHNTLTNAAGQIIIKTNSSNPKGPANSITQKVNAKGGIDRNYYGADGKQIKQVSNNDHGKPKLHPYGIKGEHTHDYIWDEDTLIDRPMRRLTDIEREENGDIL